MASGSGGSMSPSLTERREDPNLQRLLKEAAAAASQLEHLYERGNSEIIFIKYKLYALCF
jgi:hypothetical protein